MVVVFLDLVRNSRDELIDGQFKGHLLNVSLMYMGEYKRLNLLDLPVEVLRVIIKLLTYGAVDLNANLILFSAKTYLNNVFRTSSLYWDLLSLSSTCKAFRILLSRFLFAKVSLVRCNEIDVLMTYPESSRIFSGEKKYRQLVLNEILQLRDECHLKEVCEKSEGDSYKSLLGFHNYTTHLECSNASLMNGDLALFKNLHSLKVLDTALTQEREVLGLQNIKDLSVNVVTFMNFASLLLTILKNLLRLNLFIDLNEIDALKFSAFSSKFEEILNLEEVNFFISNSHALKYDDILGFLGKIFKNSKRLKSANFRLLKGNGRQEKNENNNWSIYNNDELSLYMRFVETIFQLSGLIQLGIDIEILDALSFAHMDLQDLEVPSKRHKNTFCITLIDKSFSSPRFKPILLTKLSILALYGQCSDISLQYGEVIDQCHIQALNSMINFMEFLTAQNDTNTIYRGIRNVSIEKCWSFSDDAIIRDYYQNLIYNKQKVRDDGIRMKIDLNIKAASPIGRITVNSPRYRIRENYSVNYNKDSSISALSSIAGSLNQKEFSLMYALPKSNNTLDDDSRYLSSSEYFWTVELLLLELEYYCAAKKKLSSIWD